MKRVLAVIIVLSLALSMCCAFAEDIWKYGTLSKGDKGEGVRQLQVLLINMGYLSGLADGIYGNMTADSVTRFQSDNGLIANGIADQATVKLMFERESERLSGVPFDKGERQGGRLPPP